MFLDVTPELMKQIMRGALDESITYKGVRLFVAGKQEKILASEKMKI